MIVNLENLEGLSTNYFIELKKLDHLFKANTYLSHFENHPEVKQLISEINCFCMKNEIIGFHYTNALENDILEKGLIIRTGKEIRGDFEKNHFHLFTRNEQKIIKEKWMERFGEKDEENRDNRTFFNFTKTALSNGGAESLLKYYGGEQIYFPFFETPEISNVLMKIGKPMILKCSLNPNEIKTFIENPWGKIVVSSYHRRINSEALQIDQDGFQLKGVAPEKIEIINANRYVC